MVVQNNARCEPHPGELTPRNLPHLSREFLRTTCHVFGFLCLALVFSAQSATAADLDGDSIDDSVDIDDDNDGVLDFVEQDWSYGLVVNGGFENGNIAFTSDYTLDTSGATYMPAEGQYIIVTNPNSAHSFFQNITDVSGTGNMMVINGSDTAGEAMWRRTETVVPGETFTFGTYIHNVAFSDGDPMPDFELQVNGTVVASLSYISINDGWVWVAGEYIVPAGVTSVTLEMVNQATDVSGNDFAVDQFTWARSYNNFADTDGDSIPNHLDLDSDNDGISDLYESGASAANIAVDTDSSGSVSIIEANAVLGAGSSDADSDGLMDMFDLDTTSATTAASVGTVLVDTDGNSLADLLDLDSDGDGIPDMVEGQPTTGYVANDGNVADQDTDLDGVIDLFDSNDATTGDFGGTFNTPEDTDSNATPDFRDLDSDGDTSNDSAEIAAALTPTYADPDGAVTTTLASLQNTDTDAADVDFRSLNDGDGDGVPDTTDQNDADVCIPNVGGIPTTKDCDGDGNPVATDPDDAKPNASNDTGTPGTSINILANDDYLPNNDATNIGTTSITAVATGTTCTGTPTYNAATGTVSYASASTETSGTCDLVYQVCNTGTAAGAVPVCTTATVTITLADTDGDGVPDDLDTAPSDACVPSVTGTPGTKDCDGDGNPASSDPDPTAPNAANDSGAAGSAINLLSNDDFLPNNDATNVGTTSITGIATGTTCLGSSSFDATTGSLTYTPAASEISGTCDVVYEVCSVPAGGGTPVCETATVTITLADSDGDGIPDNLDSDPANPCVPNTSGTPGSKDCDGDGNPASSDPDPSSPNAANDTGSPGAPIDLLANDDYLPNNDPANLGTTTISAISTGTTCTGAPTFDANTGSMTYAAAASDTSGTCDVVYEVCNMPAGGGMPVCSTATVTLTLADSDGDGIPDSIDSAPTDACVPNMAGTPATKDCDGDGNPVSSDPDPLAPDASHDTGVPGTPIDILANDDYLPNNDPNVVGTTSLTQIGGTCTGSVVLDANTGLATYTAGSGDTGATCSIIYRVCSSSHASAPKCENANITITNQAPPVGLDSDGDGIPDASDPSPADACMPNMGGTPASKDCDGDGIPVSNDPDPADACVPDMGGTPASKDCDGDGNPAATDPDPGVPQAADDTGTPGVPVDLLSNDDFLPNNDPDVVGTTSIAQVGGTCTGTAAFNAANGSAIYTTGAGDTGSSCTVIYEVCSTSTGLAVCSQAVLSVAKGTGSNPNPNPSPVTDSDGDGIPDTVEGTGDSDGDGVPDYLDLDSDNDGLLDSTEMTEDTDNDGILDYLDRDSDNDGLTDTLEAGGADANGDGIVDLFVDNNNDGWDDNVAASPLPETDFDGDGFVDYLDLDSDNDGLADIVESMGSGADSNNDGMIDSPVDTNGDGLADNFIANDIVDTDQDGSPDHLDLDSDNDGKSDLVEAGGSDSDGDGRVDTWQDDDNDGIPNLVDVDFTGGVDADNDGIDDFADADFVFAADSDGDGIIDQYDADQQGNGFAPITSDAPPAGQADGVVRIGLQGNGCTVATQTASFDPILPGLALLSLLWLHLRRRLSSKLALVFAAPFVLTGCSFSGVQSLNPFGKNEPTYVNNTATPAVGKDRKFRRHVYAGAGLGASWLEPDTSEVEGVDVNDRVNTGGQVTLGADVTKHFSVELHSADLGSAGLSPEGRINYHLHGGSALLYAGKNRHQHARRGFTGYGRLGFGMLDDSAIGNVSYVKDNGTHVLLGAGLEYAWRRGLGLRAELMSFDADVKYGQLGLIYRMGGDHNEKPVQIVQAPTPAPEPLVIEEPYAPPVTAVVIPEPVDPCAQFSGVLEGVNFHTDSANLTSSAEQVLDGVASELALCPGTPVAISAHTDNQGSAEYNIGLSKKRAISVARYLSGRGVEVGRMSARAFGESQPLEANTTEQGRARNRRVELVAR